MHEDKQQLGDVIVTGYQRISRERSTAAFGFFDSEQLNRQMHSDLASSLEGQVAGLRMNINSNTDLSRSISNWLAYRPQQSVVLFPHHARMYLPHEE